MRSGTRRHGGIGFVGRRLGGEQGIVIVVVMMLCMVFLILGLALYWLSTSQIRGAETERKDVKAFNVAEAGVDAGMLALKLNWPFASGDGVTVAEQDVTEALRDNNSTLHLPSNSPDSEFLQVTVYDNSKYDTSSGGYTTATEPPDTLERVSWDANADGKMFVDATSNVQDDRHRILLVAERQAWNLNFPVGVALFANVVDSNGTGYGIEIESTDPPAPRPIRYDVNDVQGKGINEGVDVDPAGEDKVFDEVITDPIIRALKGLAIQKGTYFTDDDEAETFVTSAQAGGSVVYLESSTAVDITGSSKMGSEDMPIVVIIDCTNAPSGTEVGWDMRGTADFYGILVVLGDIQLRGTCSVHGAVYTSGTMLNKGTGSSSELYYNQNVVANINRIYVLSVNVVANTWEEYTVPQGQ